MCGIAGAKNKQTVENTVEHLKHRGSSCKVKEYGEFSLAHVLHSIVGEVEQPLGEDGIISANCEIYNWKDLNEKYGWETENDAQTLLKLLEKKGVSALEELDGIYAFAYFKDGELILARDKLGMNPIWYAETGEDFVFASEKQALEKEDFKPRELHPRRILKYDLKTGEVCFENREFFEIDVDESKELEEAAEEVKELFVEAVEKRVPDTDLALLFSGGVDSTMVAAALQELDIDFTCYTSGIQHGNVNAPRDMEWAKKVAEEMDLELESYEASLEEVETELPKITDWISSTSVVKNGVALPFHLALRRNSSGVSGATEDPGSSTCGDEKVVMTGLGSEQLYAGYHRHQGYLNKECLSGLRSLFENDLYRDGVVSFRNGYELRAPFLDHELIEHALTLPEEFKVKDEYRKYVVRLAAEKLGVPEEVAWRGKTAAQYGSNFDKAISRLAKDNGFDHKQGYLNSFRSKENNRLAALTSGGKDSNAALYRAARRNNEISCLVNLSSGNKESYMFDARKTSEEMERQSEITGSPLLVQQTDGEKEKELQDLEKALGKAIEQYDVEGVIAGAIASTYQRDRVEKVAERLGLKVFAPLWQENQENYMRWLVREGFGVQITHVAARGLEENWIGTVIDEENVEELIDLSQEYGFNAAGEGGEYETRVKNFPKSITGL
ncbi:diphthine--ammonia ligase [Candidatus Nanohalococcus occultus]|uniref:diphthine--ammonia ligase n=1 Tax=Candidatus Nanohalococcus occultus TaxID=2978047 RepID=UPI0039DFB221